VWLPDGPWAIVCHISSKRLVGCIPCMNANLKNYWDLALYKIKTQTTNTGPEGRAIGLAFVRGSEEITDKNLPV